MKAINKILIVLFVVSCSPEERQPEIQQTCYTMVEVTELPCLTDNKETGVIVRYESEYGQEYTKCFYPPEQAVNNLGSTICLSD